MNALTTDPITHQLDFIMLVSNRPENALRWKSHLSGVGITAAKVFLVEDALSWLAENDTGRPNAIVTDATETVDRIARIGNFPILAVLDHLSEARAMRARDAGAADSVDVGASKEEYILRLSQIARRNLTSAPVIFDPEAFGAACGEDMTRIELQLATQGAQCSASALRRVLWNRLRPNLPAQAILGQDGLSRIMIALPQTQPARVRALSRALRSDISRAPFHLTDDGPAIYVKASAISASGKQATQRQSRLSQWDGKAENAPLAGLDTSALSVVSHRAARLRS